VEDDVDVWRYTIVELHARNDDQPMADSSKIEGTVTISHACSDGLVIMPTKTMYTTLCFKKKFTLLLFAITKSDVDRFQ